MDWIIDLHNHSCLSPCASLDMSPSNIALKAKQNNIDIIALTDHNSCSNVPAFQECLLDQGILGLYGMEAQTTEEVHILCLFSTVENALEFSEMTKKHLPFYQNDPDKTGYQLIVDKDEIILSEEEQYLGVSLDFSISDLCEQVIQFGGIIIPAHIDRPYYSMASQLGFLPDGKYSAVECMQIPPSIATSSFPVISGSDAHVPEHIGRRSFFLNSNEDFISNGIINLKNFQTALQTGTITYKIKQQK